MSLDFAMFAVALFVSVFFLLEGGWLLWERRRGPEAVRTRRRVGAVADERAVAGARPSLLAADAQAGGNVTLHRLVRSSPMWRALERWLRQSGHRGDLSAFLARTMMFAAVPLVLTAWARLPFSVMLAAAVAGALLPALQVRLARHKRVRRFEARFPDALDLLSRALRSGHSLPTALKFVADKSADPIGPEFQIVFDEITYGIPLQQAMVNMAERVPSMDLRYFVVAVLIQRDTGGNLAELLDNLSYLVRERFKLVGRVRVLAAEGKLAAWILSALPFVVAAFIFVVNPGFMATLWTDPAGRTVSMYALSMMAVGVFWMSRIVRIRV